MPTGWVRSAADSSFFLHHLGQQLEIVEGDESWRANLAECELGLQEVALWVAWVNRVCAGDAVIVVTDWSRLFTEAIKMPGWTARLNPDGPNAS